MHKHVRALIFALLLTLFAAPAWAQSFVYRIDPQPVQTVSGNVPIGGYPTIYAVPNATIKLCTTTACTVTATAYTDATGNTSCPGLSPVTLPGTNVCVSTTGPQGQFGFWIAPGTYYFTVTTTTGTFGPYPISSPTVGTLGGPGIVSANAAGGLSVMTGVLDVSLATGASASVKVTAAANALPASGGTLDARNIQGAQTWNTDAFSGITKPMDFQCGVATYTVSASSTLPATVHLIAGEGCQFSVNSGITLTLNGPMEGSSLSPHFAGSGVVTVTNSAPIFPQWFAGANAGAQIGAAEAAIPASGGVIDARGLQGSQTISGSDPFTGVTQRINLLWPAGTTASAISLTFPSTMTVDFPEGGILSMAVSTTATVLGEVRGTKSQHFAGAGSVLLTGTVPLEWFAGIGDGVTDNSTAFAAAISAISVGTIQLSNASYKTTQTININKSNLTLDGGNGEILFQPTGPFVATVNDRAVNVYSGSTGIAGPYNLSAAGVVVGATSFVAAVTANVAGMVSGQWLVVYEIEPNLSPLPDAVVIDWVQVASVSGSTVNVFNPFRVAFPGTHSTTVFVKVNNLVQNTTVRNLRCRTTDAVDALPCFAAAYVRGVVFDNLTSSPLVGNGFYSYRSQGLTIVNSRQLGNQTQGTEIAESVDVNIHGSNFGSFNATANTAALTIDMGTAFFSVTGNVIQTANPIGVQILNGPQSGVFSNNVISYVGGSSGVVGLVCIACQHLSVSGNVLTGGGGTSNGMNFVSSSGWVVNIASTGNIIGPNLITNFTNHYGAKLTTDLYLDTFNDNEFNASGAIESTLSTTGTGFQIAKTGEAAARYTISDVGLVTLSDGTTADYTLSRLSPGLASFSKNLTANRFVQSTANVSLVNGQNDNIAVTTNYIDIIGPTGSFSITGFTAPAIKGVLLYVFNSVPQAMTIKNTTGSTASWQIETLTNADVTLRSGPSFATFAYDPGESKWVLVATN